MRWTLILAVPDGLEVDQISKTSTRKRKKKKIKNKIKIKKKKIFYLIENKNK